MPAAAAAMARAPEPVTGPDPAEVTTATELRKNLFQALDDVAEGNEVDFTYKGVLMRISLANRGSRLSRLIDRGDSNIQPSDTGWDGAAREEWEAEVRETYGD